MKTENLEIRFFRSTAGKAAITLAIAAAISVLSMSPALAEHGRGDHGRGGWHEHRGWHGGYGGYGYNYAQPVYAPPPVYYPPQPSPGVSVLFPLNLRIR